MRDDARGKGQGNGGTRSDHDAIHVMITVAVGNTDSQGDLEYYWSVTPELASMVAPRSGEAIT